MFDNFGSIIGSIVGINGAVQGAPYYHGPHYYHGRLWPEPAGGWNGSNLPEVIEPDHQYHPAPLPDKEPGGGVTPGIGGKDGDPNDDNPAIGGPADSLLAPLVQWLNDAEDSVKKGVVGAVLYGVLAIALLSVVWPGSPEKIGKVVSEAAAA